MSAALALSLTAAPVALADSGQSSNWAGYAVHRPGVSFSSVSASWTQPRARCRRGHRKYSAVWVGLGGFAFNSQALEQVGTEIDCTRSGQISSTAWYELVPQASRNIHMRVRPGDQMAAAVAVVGHQVTISLADVTTHASFQRTVSASLVDVSSAEWIVEAPSECLSASLCRTLPLANFGTATFTSARAQSTSGHAGTISDPTWGNTKISLRPGGRRFVVYHGSGVAAGAANPSILSPDGSSFSVSFLRVRVFGRQQPAGSGRPRAGHRAAPYIVH